MARSAYRQRTPKVYICIVVGLIWFLLVSLFLIELLFNSTAKQETSQNTGLTVFDLSDFKTRAALINQEEKIHNEEKFGPLQNDSLVIAVQVHSRILYLKHLISSLRAAHGISSVLLVFSHDFFDEEINSLIQTIDFCKVMQIFYPYSIILNKWQRKVPYSGDKNETCREPSTVQLKHHWWWKANKIFRLAALRRYEGLVLFLEEDLYLVKDFISVLKLMESVTKESCKNCRIISLADDFQAVNLDFRDYSHSLKAIVSNRFSSRGFAFTRATWLEIIHCNYSFSLYDEYNYDYSLQYVFTACMKNAMAMTLNAARVFHLGVCGTHFKADDCDPSAEVSKIRRDIVKYRNSLYPKRIRLTKYIDWNKLGGPYGGWSDPRDQALCLDMANG